DHIVVAAEHGHLVGDELDLVGDDADAPDVHAERAQLAAEIEGVGVFDLARQDLVADEDDARGLRHAVRNSTTDWPRVYHVIHGRRLPTLRRLPRDHPT